MTRGVVLASSDASARRDLARYLEGAGFEVHELDRPPTTHDAPSLVWLTGRDDDPDITVVEAWLDASAERCAVIVTWRKAALRSLLDRFADRLVVLASPVFGYQLVDALRGAGPADR